LIPPECGYFENERRKPIAELRGRRAVDSANEIRRLVPHIAIRRMPASDPSQLLSEQGQRSEMRQEQPSEGQKPNGSNRPVAVTGTSSDPFVDMKQAEPRGASGPPKAVA
jgi:hypothetical protein